MVTEQADLTISQIAAYLRVSKRGVDRLREDGLLTARRVPGKGRDGAKRIPRADLEALIAASTVPAEQVAA